MSNLLLTEEERKRFGEYLEREINSAKIMLEQVKKLNIPPYEKKLELDIIAFTIVHKYITNVETVTVRK